MEESCHLWTPVLWLCAGQGVRLSPSPTRGRDQALPMVSAALMSQAGSGGRCIWCSLS